MSASTSPRMPVSWQTAVEIWPFQGRDRFGDPLPLTGEPVTVSGCLVGPGSGGMDDMRDTGGRTDNSSARVTLYGPSGMDVRSRDKVLVPDTHLMAGEYEVLGDAMMWPMGTAVSMRRVDGSAEG